MAPGFACTAAQVAKIAQLSKNETLASYICSEFDVSLLGEQGALLAWTVQELHQTKARLAHSERSNESLSLDVDIAFVTFSTALVFAMQIGFAMFVAGVVRAKSLASILLKNFIDTAVTGVCFYLIGYGFAYGNKEPTNPFIGNWNFAISDLKDDAGNPAWHNWTWGWVFCSASATIVAGAVAERATFLSYLLWSAFFSIWVYPVVAYWNWSDAAWLSAHNPDAILGIGAIDFAGSGVVHTLGGFSSLVAAIVLKPRVGRFSPDVNQRMFKHGHSPALYLLGCFLLWFGWYGFNPGSVYTIHRHLQSQVAARAAVTTTISASSSAIATLLLTRWRSRAWDLLPMCTGAIGGLVAITAGCAVLEPWAALICGVLAAPCVVYGDVLLERLKIDDPALSFSMHGLSGVMGVLFVGFLGKEDYIVEVYRKDAGRNLMGLFYGGHGQLLLCQFIAVVVVIAWVMFWAYLFFEGMNRLGLLRIPLEMEAVGMDAATMAADLEGASNLKGDAAFKYNNASQPGAVVIQNGSHQVAPITLETPTPGLEEKLSDPFDVAMRVPVVGTMKGPAGAGARPPGMLSLAMQVAAADAAAAPSGK